MFYYLYFHLKVSYNESLFSALLCDCACVSEPIKQNCVDHTWRRSGTGHQGSKDALDRLGPNGFCCCISIMVYDREEMLAVTWEFPVLPICFCVLVSIQPLSKGNSFTTRK